MIKKIDGIGFKNMVDSAVRNLNKHCGIVNQLNVFPVPDGDTGTNMVTTIRKGLLSVGEKIDDLSSVSRKFARAVVFEARGNSGVIVSQFFRGMSENFHNVEIVESELFIKALEKGVESAYASVETPVEGTMLTVLKDATTAVKKEFNGTQSVYDIIVSFIKHAKSSLEKTPQLLPVLKEAGVVDSGGAGIVYLFEGMQKYLDGEDIEESETEAKQDLQTIDYSAFNSDSSFEYGYCTELLIQLLNGKEPFVYDKFREEISEIGNSLVVSVETDKVKIHIHTHYPEKVFEFCHRFGEFLSIKVENMTVQHTDLNKKILCSQQKNDSDFSIVAVAHDSSMQKLFVEMGADIAICCEDNISTKDYIEAFEKTEKENIIVFPNSSDAIFSAIQAKRLYKKAKVSVINSRGIAECYAALPTIDFEETNIEQVVDNIMKIINDLYVVSVAQRKNEIYYRNKKIYRNEYYSFSGKELILIGKSLEETVVETISKILKEKNKEIITIYHTNKMQESEIENIVNEIRELGFCVEIFMVSTEKLPCELTISFE